MTFKKTQTYRARAIDSSGEETELTAQTLPGLYLSIIKWSGVSLEHEVKRTSGGYGVMTGLLVRKED